MIINEKNIEIKDFKKGIQVILEAFNEQKKQYMNIINSMNEKMILLEKQINKLKEENAFYQNKLHTLQKNIKCISKSICQLKDDEILNNEEFNDNSNNNVDKNVKNSSYDKNNYLKIISDKNKDLQKVHNLNKIDAQNARNKNHKNKYINELNYYTREEDISINKKNKIYMKAINKILNNNIIKNKNNLMNINDKIINDNIKFYENRKKDKLINESNKKDE